MPECGWTRGGPSKAWRQDDSEVSPSIPLCHPKRRVSAAAVTVGHQLVTVTTKEPPGRAGLVHLCISESYSPGAVLCVMTSMPCHAMPLA